MPDAYRPKNCYDSMTVLDVLYDVGKRQEQIVERIADAVKRGDRDDTFTLAQELILSYENTQ